MPQPREIFAQRIEIDFRPAPVTLLHRTISMESPARCNGISPPESRCRVLDQPQRVEGRA